MTMPVSVAGCIVRRRTATNISIGIGIGTDIGTGTGTGTGIGTSSGSGSGIGIGVGSTLAGHLPQIVRRARELEAFHARVTTAAAVHQKSRVHQNPALG